MGTQAELDALKSRYWSKTGTYTKVKSEYDKMLAAKEHLSDLNAEVMAFEDAIYEFNIESKLEQPSSKKIRSEAVTQYVQETSEMIDLVELYLTLLSSDVEYVKKKVQEIDSVDDTMAGYVKLGS